jgi:hypothetical protein
MSPGSGKSGARHFAEKDAGCLAPHLICAIFNHEGDAMTHGRDIHSPANILPENYEYVETVYIGTVEEIAECFDNHALTLIGKSPYEGNYKAKGTCDHCGTRFAYGAVFAHTVSEDFIVVGHVCADETFGVHNRRKLDLKRAKEKAAGGRKRLKMKAAVEAMCEANPGLAEALELHEKHYILADLKHKAYRYGDLSEKQIALALKLAVEATKPVECEFCGGDHEEDHCEKREKAPVSEERLVVTGKVLGCKVKESHWGSQLKMLFRTDAGYKIWTTVPSTIGFPKTKLKEAGDFQEGIKGRRLQFKVRLDKSDDPYFCFGNRPASAKILDATAEEMAEAKARTDHYYGRTVEGCECHKCEAIKREGEAA